MKNQKPQNKIISILCNGDREQVDQLVDEMTPQFYHVFIKTIELQLKLREEIEDYEECMRLVQEKERLVDFCKNNPAINQAKPESIFKLLFNLSVFVESLENSSCNQDVTLVQEVGRDVFTAIRYANNHTLSLTRFDKSAKKVEDIEKINRHSENEGYISDTMAFYKDDKYIYVAKILYNNPDCKVDLDETVLYNIASDFSCSIMDTFHNIVKEQREDK